MNHKIITTERGTTIDAKTAYAARCNCGCGTITFGGFESRTAAREAIHNDIREQESFTH